MNSPKPKAYSYVRFSSVAQAGGDSLRRQTAAAVAYASEHGLEIDETLNVRDLGVSAFKGKNYAEGALGDFLKAVDVGRVKKGSYLLVEHLDRLSRLPVMEALHIFQEIIRRDISIVTLRDQVVYSSENLNDNWTKLIVALATMAGANEESAKKAERVSQAWGNKKLAAREKLTPIGNNAPLWLEYIAEPTPMYVINDVRQKIVQRIFELSINGYGKEAIVKLLNSERIASFKNNTWGVSSIQRLLSNRAVLGEYQPFLGHGKHRVPSGDAILAYYPQIISETKFYQAQQAIASRKNSSATKQSTNFSVWQGVATCTSCLSTLQLVNKGKPPKGRTYLRCSGARKGVCNASAIPLQQSELIFKEILAKLDGLSLIQESGANLTMKLAEIEGRISVDRKKLVELENSMRAYPSNVVARLLGETESGISNLENDKKKVLTDLATDEILDKKTFFSKLDLVTYEGRYRANEFFKRNKIAVSILRTQNVVRYVIERDSEIVFGISQEGERISSLAFSSDFKEKIKAQDFDGSIGSTLRTLIQERFAEMLQGIWWDDTMLDQKIHEMMLRIDVVLPSESPSFQEIRNHLTTERMVQSQAFKNLSLVGQELIRKNIG